MMKPTMRSRSPLLLHLLQTLTGLVVAFSGAVALALPGELDTTFGTGGRVIDTLASTVVRVITADGAVGYGEACPLGATYLPAHAAGVRAARARRDTGPGLELSHPRGRVSAARVGDRAQRGRRAFHRLMRPLVDASWLVTGASVASSALVTWSRPCASDRNASERSEVHFTGRPPTFLDAQVTTHSSL